MGSNALILRLQLLFKPLFELAQSCKRRVRIDSSSLPLWGGACRNRLFGLRTRLPPVPAAILLTVIALMMRGPAVLLRLPRRRSVLAGLGFRRSSSRCLWCMTVPMAVAILVPVTMPVMMTAAIMPLFPPSRRQFLPSLTLRPVLACRCAGAMSLGPALLSLMPLMPSFAIRTAMMTPFALALRPLELGLHSAEAPDFLEFRFCAWLCLNRTVRRRFGFRRGLTILNCRNRSLV